ncbi:MAG: N-acetylmuramoyl-L-alanine amidase [Verrucomicrobia bacterium]|nr:N-acetylmuramoyl-L-alanine amidase [Verrucomicrobiota bacterium]
MAPDLNSRREAQHTWRRAGQFLPNEKQPLSGVSIAIDPGHLGGEWARMEERWFQIGNSTPVAEGDMTLRVAKLLAPKLQEFGARVTLVRSETSPLTTFRPEQLAATPSSHPQLNLPYNPSSMNDPGQHSLVSTEAQLLFYRVAEIRERAKVINEQIRPDLTLCLHFNAEPWGDPEHPTLVQTNHLHLLVNGAYSNAELSYDDVRFCMLRRILDRCFSEELPLSETIAPSMAATTRLPPYSYTTSSARPIGKTGYVWARNLLANRIYDGPVLYLEPYVMNSFEVFDRIQAGEYQGSREFNGIMRVNIYEEYAAAVTAGLVQYFRENRGHLR